MRCFPPFTPDLPARRAVFLEAQHLETLGVRIALLLARLFHPALDEVDAVFVDLRAVREEGFDLHIDDVAHVDDRVRRPERHEEKSLRLVRLEALLLPELGEHLPRRRVRIDGAKNDF